jgi:hypothetical protein
MGDENKARISQGVGNAESNVAIATQTGDKIFLSKTIV